MKHKKVNPQSMDCATYEYAMLSQDSYVQVDNLWGALWWQ